MSGLAHRAFGFAAFGIAVGALLFFAWPSVEAMLGETRAGILHAVIVLLFVVAGLRLVFFSNRSGK